MFLIFWLLAFLFKCTFSQYMSNPECQNGLGIPGNGNLQRIQSLSERLHLTQVEMQLCEVVKQIDTLTNNMNGGKNCITASIKNEVEKALDSKMPNIVDNIVTKLGNHINSYIIMYLGMKPVTPPTQAPTTESTSTTTQSVAFPEDCLEIRNISPMKHSGTYQIKPQMASEPFLVYCDMNSYGGGWTAVMFNEMTYDNLLFIDSNWQDYKRGFTNVGGDIWLGLEHLYELTNSKPHELLFEITPNGRVATPGTYTARYQRFRISGERSRYTIEELYGFSGDAADAFSENRGNMFHTFDKDTTSLSCASTKRGKGGWWHYTNSAAPLVDCGKTSPVHWYPTSSANVGLNAQKIRMMIRPTI